MVPDPFRAECILQNKQELWKLVNSLPFQNYHKRFLPWIISPKKSFLGFIFQFQENTLNENVLHIRFLFPLYFESQSWTGWIFVFIRLNYIF